MLDAGSLDGRTDGELGPALDRCERENDVVLLAAGADTDEAWQAFCLRQADRVLLLADANLKGRNALILSFHRVCLPLAELFAQVVAPVLASHGAPAELLQPVRVRSSRQRTARFMAHPDVSFVLATGGPGMVRAAYRSGTPAIGVGPGNAPAWIAVDADVRAAAEAIVASKSFDNGLICGAEHNLVVDATRVEERQHALEAAGAAVLTPDEAARFRSAAMTEDQRGFRPEVTGQSAQRLAASLGITRDQPVRLLVVPGEPDLASAMTSEKMGPFLSLFVVSGDDQAMDLSGALLDKRILVNSPGSQGVCGLTTGLSPAFTLGCSTFGGNSTTENVTWRHLANVKRMATNQPSPELQTR